MKNLNKNHLSHISKQQLAKIGRKIYQYRHRTGISQDQLANKARVSQSTLERLEDGGNISVERLARISAVTGLKFKINH